MGEIEGVLVQKGADALVQVHHFLLHAMADKQGVQCTVPEVL
jgi:hypothetical protein